MRGFTLIEGLICLAIVCILLAVIVPAYQKHSAEQARKGPTPITAPCAR